MGESRIMAMGQKKLKFLDGEECFMLWFELGSITKVVYNLSDKGVHNTLTGEPPTRMGVWNAAWRWAIFNLEESRPIMEEAYRKLGKALTDEEWVEMVVRKARTVLNHSAFKKYIASRNFTNYA